MYGLQTILKLNRDGVLSWPGKEFGQLAWFSLTGTFSIVSPARVRYSAIFPWYYFRKQIYNCSTYLTFTKYNSQSLLKLALHITSKHFKMLILVIEIRVVFKVTEENNVVVTFPHIVLYNIKYFSSQHHCWAMCSWSHEDCLVKA